MKKILTILIILVIILGGVLIYFYLTDKGTGTEDRGGFSLADFIPFGRTPQNTGTTSADNSSENIAENQPVISLAKLKKISEVPVAGGIILPDGNTVRYIERATGHIYDANINTLVRKKISNTTIPKIYDALWLAKGEAVIMRYIKENTGTVETFYAKISKDKTASSAIETEGAELKELEGTFLAQSIEEIILSPKKDKILYSIKSGNGSAIITANPDGGKATQILSSGVGEWLLNWPKDDTIVLTTKPSANVLGYTYTLPSKGGAMRKAIGDIPGLLVFANSNMSQILYSKSENNELRNYVFNTKTNSAGILPIQTIPEKCVWNQKGDTLYCLTPKAVPQKPFPNDWYQGLTSFSDEIWTINITDGSFDIIADPKEEARVEIDGIKPSLSEDESRLLFTNKKDGTLWSLRLKDFEAES